MRVIKGFDELATLSGQEIGKSDWIVVTQDMVDQFGQPGTDIMPYELKVVTAGDDVAIVTYNVVLRVPPSEDQGPPPRYQHFSTVWVKQGDLWKMKFQQQTANHWGDW